MNESKKYGRSLHAPISLGTTSDDRFMPSGYLQEFAKMDDLVVTEKLDGQNNCFNKYGVFARSHASVSLHPWDKPLRERWELLKGDLGDLEIFGENMYGIHSIAYSQLESYYYVFAIRENDRWLSWEEVKFYADFFDFPTVPEIKIIYPLKVCFQDHQHLSEDQILEQWLTINLGISWQEAVQTSGLLGGYSPVNNQPCCEGFVIRNSQDFGTNQGQIKTAKNEFNNLFKLVRQSHVKTNIHWMKTWKPAKLINYSQYHWHSYQFLENKSM